MDACIGVLKMALCSKKLPKQLYMLAHRCARDCWNSLSMMLVHESVVRAIVGAPGDAVPSAEDIFYGPKRALAALTAKAKKAEEILKEEVQVLTLLEGSPTRRS